ncbi:hypothetical protein DB347_14480 [Opitutaceae bacterium EW11]|nr:hypothetical protein DB347_14480 [Opitutaceae bacterium EW11]
MHARFRFLVLTAALLVSVLGRFTFGAAPDATPELPFLSPVFGDHMVLQRGKAAVLWGWTEKGAEVRVSVGEKTAKTRAGEGGRWEVRLEPLTVGGPYTLKIDGPKHVTIDDVLVGDVWLCGGQSNMQFSLERARDGAAEVAAANRPRLRLYTVGTRSAYGPVAVPKGSWQVCSPETAAKFSAVGYFFGQRIESAANVPVGLVSVCLGGTPAECWTSAKALRALGGFGPELDEMQRLHAEGAPEYGSFLMHWFDRYDAGAAGKTWADPALDDSGWKPVKIPGGFAELGVPETPSVCWFRRDVELPDPLPAGQAFVRLGVIEKMDTAYVNGQWVGASSWVENPRVYPLPAALLKPGKNKIALRIFRLSRPGGFLSPASDLQIVLGDKSVVPLAGDWKGKLSVDARPPHPLPLAYENYPVMPAVLQQGMLAPLAPMGIKGAIWYQGEANSERAQQYRSLLPTMIADWRQLFGQGDFPFYIVSLPAFMERREKPGDDSWAELREAQAFAAHTVSNAGLAVTIDTGDAKNIHPIDKKIVGERLALCALAKTYGQPVACEGPRYVSARREGPGLRIQFDHATGLHARNGAPGEFALAGADRVWHRASATIEGTTVLVSSPEVQEPIAARYAWQANPVANLYNGDDLPAEPFRTDDWPGVTK